MPKGPNLDEIGGGEDIVERFNTYNEYLSSQLTDTDLEYLEDEDMARQLVELGYRGNGEVIRREDFEERKRILKEKANKSTNNTQKQLSSTLYDLSDSIFLQAIASREEAIKSGKLTTIVYIRDYNAKGQEISGYIDLTQRMREPDFEDIYSKRQKLLPRPSDLSYFNYDTKASTANSTSQFQVIADSSQGLLFKNKRDRKIINVNPYMSEYNSDVTVRSDLTETTEYIQVAFFDHSTRRKI